MWGKADEYRYVNARAGELRRQQTRIPDAAMGTDWAPPPAKSEGLPSAEALVPADAQRASQRADFEAALAAAEPESEPEPPSGSPEPWAANMRVGSMTFALDDDVQMIPGAPTGDEPDGQHNSNAPNRGEDVCYHCKKLGHWKRECPLLRNSQQAYTKPKKPTSHMRRTSTEQWQHEVSGPAMRVFVGNKASAHQLAPEVYREYRKVAASTRHLRKTSGGNGPLHVQHFKQLTHHLGANLSRTEIRAELATLDPESTGSVPLAALDQWWCEYTRNLDCCVDGLCDLWTRFDGLCVVDRLSQTRKAEALPAGCKVSLR